MVVGGPPQYKFRPLSQSFFLFPCPGRSQKWENGSFLCVFFSMGKRPKILKFSGLRVPTVIQLCKLAFFVLDPSGQNGEALNSRNTFFLPWGSGHSRCRVVIFSKYQSSGLVYTWKISEVFENWELRYQRKESGRKLIIDTVCFTYCLSVQLTAIKV